MRNNKGVDELRRIAAGADPETRKKMDAWLNEHVRTFSFKVRTRDPQQAGEEIAGFAVQLGGELVSNLACMSIEKNLIGKYKVFRVDVIAEQPLLKQADTTGRIG